MTNDKKNRWIYFDVLTRRRLNLSVEDVNRLVCFAISSVASWFVYTTVECLNNSIKWRIFRNIHIKSANFNSVNQYLDFADVNSLSRNIIDCILFFDEYLRAESLLSNWFESNTWYIMTFISDSLKFKFTYNILIESKCIKKIDFDKSFCSVWKTLISFYVDCVSFVFAA